MESAIVPLVARNIVTVSGDESARSMGTVIAANTTNPQYTTRAAFGRIARVNTQNATATRRSCHTSATGTHGLGSMDLPHMAAARATMKTTNRQAAITGGRG